MILKQDFEINNIEYNLNFSNKEILSLIQNVSMNELNCFQYYSAKSLDLLNEIEWLFKDNDCEIVINNCKFNKDDEHDFNISFSGETIEKLNVDLGIAYQASKAYKNKVLTIFKGYMKYDGDS
jgi:hypothetical protein